MTPWTVAHQAPLSMGFPRQEYGVGCHFLLQEIFLTQELNPCLLCCHVDSLPLHHQGSPFYCLPLSLVYINYTLKVNLNFFYLASYCIGTTTMNFKYLYVSSALILGEYLHFQDWRTRLHFCVQFLQPLQQVTPSVTQNTVILYCPYSLPCYVAASSSLCAAPWCYMTISNAHVLW